MITLPLSNPGIRGEAVSVRAIRRATGIPFCQSPLLHQVIPDSAIQKTWQLLQKH